MIQSVPSPEPKDRATPIGKDRMGVEGLFIAIGIMAVWAYSLFLLLSLNISLLPISAIGLATIWQSFLYTGLFITAHDAMHGVVFPQNHKINHLVGSIAIFLYALFSYKGLLQKHWLHHHYPASKLDPDFHDGKHKGFFAWYFHFIKGYWSWTQITGITIIFHTLHHLLHIAIINLILFWSIPPILSSLQLFYFGTFLPHKEPEGGYSNRSHAQSNSYSTVWSFLTCYHFGYHEEHHEYPHIPWWQLPKIYRRRTEIL